MIKKNPTATLTQACHVTREHYERVRPFLGAIGYSSKNTKRHSHSSESFSLNESGQRQCRVGHALLNSVVDEA